VLDEYSLLKENEVVVLILDDTREMNPGDDRKRILFDPKPRIIEGDVFVTRNPCLHPGDIRLLKAVNSPEIFKAFGHLTNCIVFPQKGRKPLTAMMAGGDLDGDLYFVCWEKTIIPKQVAEPMEYKAPSSKKKNKITIFTFSSIFFSF
jgi:RNA-dependent RNA polymerase